jgi:putative ABC transport system permease protein
MVQDLRYTGRLLAKSPGFTLVALLALALGIGGNTAMFSMIYAVVLKPLEYHDPNRLLSVEFSFPSRPGAITFTPVRLEEMRAAHSIAELGSFLIGGQNFAFLGGAGPEALKGYRVSANFLDILGVRPVLGRGFLPEEDDPGSRPVVLISSELWRRQFAGNPQAVGKTVALDDTAYTIVGVMPPHFEFPAAGIDVWVPRPSAVPGVPPQLWPIVPAQVGFARLKPGATLEQARAELNVLSRGYVQAHKGMADADPSSTVQLQTMQDGLTADIRPTLWMLFGAVALVLLIACANVAGLLLARAASRSREFAVRAAVGASRGRMIRQLLIESVALSAAGGVLGVLLAEWGVRVVSRVNAIVLPRADEIHLNGAVLAFTLSLSIVVGILFGVIPAFRASRPDATGLLRLQGAGAAQGRPHPLGLSARGILVTAQVALSIVLLIGAALLIQSLARVRSVNPGFEPANLLTMHIALPLGRFSPPQQRAFWEELVQRLLPLPGVRGATVTQTLPMTVHFGSAVAITEFAPVSVGERPLAVYSSVLPGYFHTLGIPLVQGRAFDDSDVPGRRPVALINESFARRFWPQYPAGENPIGRHVLLGVAQQGGVEIVGIVGDVHEYGPAEDMRPELYLPLAQLPVAAADLAVRTTGDPMLLVSAVRRQVSAIDRNQPVSAIRTMEEVLDDSVGRRRLIVVLLSSFAGMALLLAMLGIYGVIAYSVAQRTQEVGIRRAMGAQEGDILRWILGHGLRLTLAGVLLGIGGALALTRVIKSLLFHTTTTDPAAFIGVALLFVVVALLASFIPAHRATRIDPMTALRVG